MRAVGDIGKSAASQLDSWRRTCVEEELWLEVDDGINDQSLYQIFYLEYIHLRCSAEIINLTYFRAQKSLNFLGPHLPVPLVMDVAHLKTITYRAI